MLQAASYKIIIKKVVWLLVCKPGKIPPNYVLDRKHKHDGDKQAYFYAKHPKNQTFTYTLI